MGLELTHGLNFLTLNVARRWSTASDRFVPFVSAGMGAIETSIGTHALNVGVAMFW